MVKSLLVRREDGTAIEIITHDDGTTHVLVWDEDNVRLGEKVIREPAVWELARWLESFGS